MKIDLVNLLQEIYAHYKSNGIAVPQTEIGAALGVEQSTVSKWLNGKNKPNRYAAPIIALHHQLTGKKIDLPVVTGETDDLIRKTIEYMQQLDERDRKTIMNLAHTLLSGRQAA